MIGQTAVQQEQQQDGEQFNCWSRHDSELPSEPQNQQCLCFFCSSSLSPPLSLWVVEQLLITGSKFELD